MREDSILYQDLIKKNNEEIKLNSEIKYRYVENKVSELIGRLTIYRLQARALFKVKAPFKDRYRAWPTRRCFLLANGTRSREECVMIRSSHVTRFMKNGVKLAGRWLIRITKEWTVPRGDTASHSLAELHYFAFLRSPESTKRSNMMYDIKWIIPKLRAPTRLWNIASSITFAAVGIFSKIIIEWLNKALVYNKHIINRALDERPKNVPLITVSNHHSCFDDPGIWATLDLRHLLSRRKMRWSLAAHDICFTNVWHSYFFMLGKCIPVVRGNGVYQEAIDFCIERLASGDWVHVFPEGKVNMFKENMRLKWGIGRLILESPVTPLVVPICHLGMDQVLPNEPPYMFKTRKKVTMNYGEPIDFSELLKNLKETKATEVEARKAITDRIQEELLRLKAATEKLHEKL